MELTSIEWKETKSGWRLISECIRPLCEVNSGNIGCPIHIIAGKNDKMFSVEGMYKFYSKVLEQGNEATIQVLKECDHAPQIMNPDAFAAVSYTHLTLPTILLV